MWQFIVMFSPSTKPELLLLRSIQPLFKKIKPRLALVHLVNQTSHHTIFFFLGHDCCTNIKKTLHNFNVTKSTWIKPELWSLSTMRSAAELEGVAISIRHSGLRRKICRTASTTVTVLPVPGSVEKLFL